MYGSFANLPRTSIVLGLTPANSLPLAEGIATAIAPKWRLAGDEPETSIPWRYNQQTNQSEPAKATEDNFRYWYLEREKTGLIQSIRVSWGSTAIEEIEYMFTYNDSVNFEQAALNLKLSPALIVVKLNKAKCFVPGPSDKKGTTAARIRADIVAELNRHAVFPKIVVECT